MSDFAINVNNVLVKYHGTASTVIIPSEVVAIGSQAFEGNTKIQEVYIPENCKSIALRAFADCINLKELIHLKDSKLEWIGPTAFAGCKSLKTISLPNTLSEIQAYAFWESDIVVLDIPENVTEIDTCLFKDCKGLIAVRFKATKPLTFKPNVFEGCDSLRWVGFATDEQAIVLEDPAAVFGNINPHMLNFKTFSFSYNDLTKKWQLGKVDKEGKFTLDE